MRSSTSLTFLPIGMIVFLHLPLFFFFFFFFFFPNYVWIPLTCIFFFFYRYDLLCAEGLLRSLRIFMQKECCPNYVAAPGSTEMLVDPAVGSVRPHVVCAVLRDCEFNAERLESFIALQDKIHQNVGRNRSIVSVGTHDLDSVRGPFRYTTRTPAEIRAVFLGRSKEMDANELFADIAQNSLHLQPFLPLLAGKERYPVIYDADGVLLSLPPILNGERSKMTERTRNVLIEVTATDRTKADIALAQIVTSFSQYCAQRYHVESVTIRREGAEGSEVTPSLAPYECRATAAYVNSAIGIQISAPEMAAFLGRMSLPSRVEELDGAEMIVSSVPVTRSDVMHACDLMEDVAIAYGFNRIRSSVPSTSTIGKQQRANFFADLLRNEVALIGYTEVLNFALCSRVDNFETLRRPEDEKRAVHLLNPATAEFQVCRTSLLVGLLHVVANNKSHKLPLDLFEVGDVVLQDNSSDTGARNIRSFAAVHADVSNTFEYIHGLLDRIVLLVPNVPAYKLRPSNNSSYFPGRGADIFIGERQLGVFGVLHPKVVLGFHIQTPVSALELNLEVLLELRDQ
jgi:phenylalanyl-tRNA synthetase beta chain